MPSFLVVAGAIACGHVEEKNDSSVDPPKTDAAAGVAANLPGTEGPTSTGGTTDVGVNPSGTGGTAGALSSIGGTFSNPPIIEPCPPMMPVDGSSCHLEVVSVGRLYPPLCSYPSNSCPTAQAVCDRTIWNEPVWDVTSCAAAGEGGAGGAADEIGGAGGHGG
jgi:hypothetical protein